MPVKGGAGRVGAGKDSANRAAKISENGVKRKKKPEDGEAQSKIARRALAVVVVRLFSTFNRASNRFGTELLQLAFHSYLIATCVLRLDALPIWSCQLLPGAI